MMIAKRRVSEDEGGLKGRPHTPWGIHKMPTNGKVVGATGESFDLVETIRVKR